MKTENFLTQNGTTKDEIIDELNKIISDKTEKYVQEITEISLIIAKLVKMKEA